MSCVGLLNDKSSSQLYFCSSVIDDATVAMKVCGKVEDIRKIKLSLINIYERAIKKISATSGECRVEWSAYCMNLIALLHRRLQHSSFLS